MPCFVVFMRTCPHKFLYAKFAVESVLFYKAVVMYVMHNLFGGLVWYGVAHRYFTLKAVLCQPIIGGSDVLARVFREQFVVFVSVNGVINKYGGLTVSVNKLKVICNISSE